MAQSAIFPVDFQIALRALVNVHHSIYPRIPPQGIYFEALVQEAFTKIKKPFTVVEGTARDQPSHDLLVEEARLSLKTETGAGTDPQQISITKLCTTEREPWAPAVLIERVMRHLDRYDVILMLRAIWELPLIHYQLLEIPIEVLKLIRNASLQPVGRRKGRQSLGADVSRGRRRLFHVHFDGSDGKCQIRNLHVRCCNLLAQWDLHVGR
jgi:type II restriction enzyme